MSRPTPTRWHILRVGSGGRALCGKRWHSLRVDSPIADCKTCFRILALERRRVEAVAYEMRKNFEAMLRGSGEPLRDDS